MRKLLHFISLALIISLFFSCTKEEIIITDPDPIIILDSIYAGVYDTSFIFYQFPTPISLNIQMENNILVANALDTIQLQFDTTTFELIVKLKILNQDSISIVNQMDTFINLRLDIYSHDSMSFALTKELYYAGLGVVADFYFTTAYSKNNTIMSNSLWTSQMYNGNDMWYSLWNYPTDTRTLSGFDGGQWYNTGPIKYIGFSYKEHLGWIEVDISNRRNPKFISYAIQK